MIEFLNNLDSQLFLFLNGKHNGFWDFVMYWVSDTLIWIPLYVFFIFLIIKHYRKETWWILLAVAIVVTLSDQLSVHGFKNVFMRFRPCHEPNLDGLVHIVRNQCGGEFGFISSHATNHFAIATILAFLLGNKIKYFTVLVLIWAAFISYSRIYLGVHYPGDVIAGAIVGTGLGYAIGIIYKLFIRNQPIEYKRKIQMEQEPE